MRGNEGLFKYRFSAAIFRILFGLTLLGVAGWFGFAHRHPWVVIPLGICFTILYVSGKWYMWRSLWSNGKLSAWVKALASTFPIQCILAGLVYLIGLGLGRLFANQAFADKVTLQDIGIIATLTAIGISVSMIINKLEGGKGAAAHIAESLSSQIDTALAGEPAKSEDVDADFEVLSEDITPETLFSHYRGSNDYTVRALTDITMYDGSKPIREAYAANDIAFAAAEAKMGFKLPDALKNLYRVKDGGSVSNIMIAKCAEPRPTYDDWTSAFGGYDDMYSLKKLRTVHDSILDFAYEDDEEAFPKGAKKMLILAQWYQQTTFLDYREAGEPRVGIADFDDVNWKKNGIWFENFDDFFSKLKRVDSDAGREDMPRPITRLGPQASHPDGFWPYKQAAENGADETLWAKFEKRLKVKQPHALKPFLAAVNGGEPYFNILPELTGETGQLEGLDPFPGGRLFGVHQWVSLKELSGRLEFTDGHTPWSELWDTAHKLIVISGSFDTALMLDYRGSEAPEILYVQNLDKPAEFLKLGSADNFIVNLRAIRDPHFMNAPIGDIRLSARSASPSTFWHPGKHSPVSEDDVKRHEARLDHEFPDVLKSWMQTNNGGPVRFRYLPPEEPNLHGYLNAIPSSSDWINVFPDGILPIEKWQTLSNWLQTHEENFGEALRQRGHNQFVQDEYGDPANIIILAESERRLTLLDKSRENSAENAGLVLLTKENQGWAESYRTAYFGNIALRARREELQ